MKQDEYDVPADQYTAETAIQKSRFICTIKRVQSLEEMRSFYEEMRKVHPKANHNCWAAVSGGPAESAGYGCSDDGEPSGTAGKPILKVLQYSGLGQVGVVVTRYFGGIKLGTGGLVRAYTEAAQAAVEGVQHLRYAKQTRLCCTLPYDQEGTFRYILSQFNLSDERFSYTEQVTVDLLVNENQASCLIESLRAKLGHALEVKQLRQN